MENKNELTLFNAEAGKVFCSKIGQSAEDKKELFNALENCDVLLNDCVGQVIELKDIYVEEREVTDEDTGEVVTRYRSILFDVNGQTYATGAYGIYNILKKIITIYGLPTWEEAIKVEVIKKPLKGGKTSLSLKLV